MIYHYRHAFDEVFANGKARGDRTGVGTRSVFAPTPMKYDLSKGFPLITEKRTWWKGVVVELQWILRGDRAGNITPMLDQDVHIWDEWADEDNKLGPVYGAQARNWRGPGGLVVDQLRNVIADIKLNPTSRRHVVSMWNPGELDQQALPPCHMFYQFYVEAGALIDLNRQLAGFYQFYVEAGKLSIQVYQRSADMFLGIPFDLASYGLLTHIIAALTDLEVGEMTYVLGDAHIYSNHETQALELWNRINRDTAAKLPTLQLPKLSKLEDYIALPWDQFGLTDYRPLPTIKAEVAV